MVRNFCVLVVEENYDSKTGKVICKFNNHRVIVGSKEQVDTYKKLFADNVKGSFEMREQAVVTSER
jgi:hypothetical protein